MGVVNGGDLRCLYAKLTERERFRLAVLAEARGDSGERDEVVVTLPVATGSIRGPQFVRSIAATGAVVDCFLSSVRECLARLEAIELCSAHTMPLLRLLSATAPGRRTSMERADRTDGSERFPTVGVAHAHAVALGELAAVLEAFASVCADGPALPVEAVLAVFAPQVREVVARRENDLAGVTADPERVASYRGAMWERWEQEA